MNESNKTGDRVVHSEIEVSEHHTVSERGFYDDIDYEVHTGMADVYHVSKKTADRVKNEIGLDLEAGDYRSGCEVIVVDEDGDSDGE